LRLRKKTKGLWRARRLEANLASRFSEHLPWSSFVPDTVAIHLFVPRSAQGLKNGGAGATPGRAPEA
jgi:hypothetical protein